MPKEVKERRVGRLWADQSGGRFPFVFMFKQTAGMSLSQQFDAAIA